MLKIAIQGYFGSFHEIAARHYFEDQKEIEILPCKTFTELFQCVARSDAQFGAVAIENTQAGSLLDNYRLLQESKLTIAGEHKLRIQHNLVALPGQSIAEITEVHSHTMAIQQCRSFFKKYPRIQLVNSHDTAFSAFEIKRDMLYGRGAIASSGAARRFQLETYAENIETNSRNFTRFLIIRNPDASGAIIVSERPVNKASLVITLGHFQGSLAALLAHFAAHRLNLTKIQSMPLIGQEWNYLFYIDLVFESPQEYRSALPELGAYAADYRILGEYSAARTSGESLARAEMPVMSGAMTGNGHA